MGFLQNANTVSVRYTFLRHAFAKLSRKPFVGKTSNVIVRDTQTLLVSFKNFRRFLSSRTRRILLVRR